MQLGADYVCDINWAADVTIMEEGTELLERLNDGGTLPMMTSCFRLHCRRMTLLC